MQLRHLARYLPRSFIVTSMRSLMKSMTLPRHAARQSPQPPPHPLAWCRAPELQREVDEVVDFRSLALPSSRGPRPSPWRPHRARRYLPYEYGTGGRLTPDLTAVFTAYQSRRIGGTNFRDVSPNHAGLRHLRKPFHYTCAAIASNRHCQIGSADP